MTFSGIVISNDQVLTILGQRTIMRMRQGLASQRRSEHLEVIQTAPRSLESGRRRDGTAGKQRSLLVLT